MSANGNSAAVRFLYGTGTGRAVLRLMQKGRADRLVVGFLKSPLSKPFIRWYAGRHGLRVDKNSCAATAAFATSSRGAAGICWQT